MNNIHISGTTSAYAENTKSLQDSTRCTWNYLRVRGEYLAAYLANDALGELTPRTRRILLRQIFRLIRFGTTSAYAENTVVTMALIYVAGNYLRVRGEYTRPLGEHLESLELPPRTRRIRYTAHEAIGISGTTSAYAENTGGLLTLCPAPRKYSPVPAEYR